MKHALFQALSLGKEIVQKLFCVFLFSLQMSNYLWMTRGYCRGIFRKPFGLFYVGESI